MKKIIVVIVLMISLGYVFSQNQTSKTKSLNATAPVTKSKLQNPEQATKVNTLITPAQAKNIAQPSNNVVTPVLPKASNNPNAPELKFVEETFDFGTIIEGPQMIHEFEFTNIGKEPIIIQNVKASCGCTTPEWPKEATQPGQKNKIKVIYNTKGRIGPFTKTVTITSNSKGGDKYLFIKGIVEKPTTTVAPEKAPSILNQLPNK
jgi:hypothetical protein